MSDDVSQADADTGAASMSLEEWCVHHSAVEPRIELIGAFFAMETRAARVRDTAEAFAGRFAAFVIAPSA